MSIDVLALNQMAGPLFYEMIKGLSAANQSKYTLVTGHPDTILKKTDTKLNIIPSYSYNRTSLVHRGFSWIMYSFDILKYLARCNSFSLVICSSNPPILPPLIILFQKIKGFKYVPVVYDIYPEVLVHANIYSDHSWVVRIWKTLNRTYYRNAEMVFTIGKYMSTNIASYMDGNTNKVKVVYPWVDTDVFHRKIPAINPLYRQYNPMGKKIILYSGNLGSNHDIESIMRAAEVLLHNEEILFLIFGTGDKWSYAERYVKQNKLDNVKMFPLQDEELLPFTLSLADISLVALENGAGELMVPSKLLYYMATGSAIVGICDKRNDVHDIVIENQCGIIVDVGSYRELAQKIEELCQNSSLLSQYKKNSREATLKIFSKTSGLNQVCSIFNEIEC
jgi:glycosyltransferase involved in cell wall biosynthesis